MNSFRRDVFVKVDINSNSVQSLEFSGTKYLNKMVQTSQNRSGQATEKQVRPKESMFASFRPIFCFSRIFGSMSFSIVCNSNGEVQSCKVKVVDVVWLAISICIYLTLVIFYDVLSLNADDYRKSGTFPLFMGSYILQWLSFIFGALFFAINLWNRYTFLDILKMFEHFDKKASQRRLYRKMFHNESNCHVILMQMSTLNVHQNYKKDYRRAWCYITISLVLISISIFLHIASVEFTYALKEFLETQYLSL